MDIRIIGAVILIAATALLILTEVAKRAYTHELASLLEQGEVRAYLALLEKPFVKLVFPAWNRSFMQLNGYLALDAYGEADSVIERMLSMRQNDRQRRELVGKAFTTISSAAMPKGRRGFSPRSRPGKTPTPSRRRA